MIPGRPGAFDVGVIQAREANAYALSTGSILVTTGLLASIKSEAELQAVLAHEVAHVMLDHHIAALRSAKGRQVWEAVAGMVASTLATEMISSISGRIGAPISTQLWLAVGADVAARILTAEIFEAIGLRFSRQQEEEADVLAQLWIMEHAKAPNALLQALERNEVDSLDAGTHPSDAYRRNSLTTLTHRLYGSGVEFASLEADSKYLAGIAPALILQARLEMAEANLDDAAGIIDAVRSIANPRDDLTGMAAFMKVQIGRLNEKSPEDALALLHEAEQNGGVPAPYIYIERGLFFVASGENERALESFDRALREMSGDESHPLQLQDWVEQMKIMLRP